MPTGQRFTTMPHPFGIQYIMPGQFVPYSGASPYPYSPYIPIQQPKNPPSSEAILVHGQFIRFDANGAMDLRAAQPQTGRLGPFFMPPNKNNSNAQARFSGYSQPSGFAFFRPGIYAMPSTSQLKPSQSPISSSSQETTSTFLSSTSPLSPYISPPHFSPPSSPSHFSPPHLPPSPPPAPRMDGIQMLIDCLRPLVEQVSSTTSNDSLSEQMTSSPEELSAPSKHLAQTATSASPLSLKEKRGRKRKPNKDDSAEPIVKKSKAPLSLKVRKTARKIKEKRFSGSSFEY